VREAISGRAIKRGTPAALESYWESGERRDNKIQGFDLYTGGERVD